MTYDEVADELYGLPPGEFTAARNDHVRRAREAGDRELAKRIGTLRKPNQAAWLVNLLWREHRGLFEELLELGESFRESYEHPSAEEMREFSMRRQRLVSTLSGHATVLAEGAGVGPGAGTVRDLESTLEAAVADPEAAAACRTGRLTEPLAYAGFGPVAAGFPGAAAPAAREPARRKPAAGPKEPADRDEAKREAAGKRVAEAREDAGEAERELDEREDAVESATSRRDDLEERIERLRRDLHDLERELSQAERDLRKERTQRDRAASAHDRAQRRLRDAETALRELS